MTDTPERIWARPEHQDENSYGGFWMKEPVEAGATEYIRADLSQAAVEAALREVAEQGSNIAERIRPEGMPYEVSIAYYEGAMDVVRDIPDLIADTGALDRALEKAREEGRREGQIKAGAIFATSDAEASWIEDMENACPACGGSGHKGDAADRIEALEAKLAEQIEWVKSLADDLIAAEGREARLKEKLAKAVDALQKMDVGEGWAAQIARTTLAELTGGKDD